MRCTLSFGTGRLRRWSRTTAATLLTILAASALTSAARAQGPPAGPDDPASAMYTLEAIYQRLATGAPGSRRGAGFVEPTTAPGTPGRSLDDVMAVCPVAADTLAARPDEVLAGRTFWGLASDGWGLQTGAAATASLSPSSTAVPAGFYAPTTLEAVDGDLASANLRAGVNVFGVHGDPDVVDTASGTAKAHELLAGSKAWVDGEEVTGTLATRTLSATTTAVSAGYYVATDLTAVDADLAGANVRSGVTLFGVAGDPDVVDTSSGTATSGELLAGRKAWVDGAEVTGTLATRTLSATSTAMSAGYYAATDLATVDADLAGANVRAGVTLFGISGDLDVVDTSSGDATAADVALGKSAWVDGALVSGTLVCPPPPPAGPQPPTALTVSTCVGLESCARIAWTPPAIWESFRVQRANGVGGTPPPASAFADVVADVAVFAVQDTGLAAGVYWYRVAAVVGGQSSSFTAPESVSIAAPVGPAPPSLVTVVTCPGAPGCARVAWTPPAIFDGFAVQRAIDLGTNGPPPDGAFADVAPHVSNVRYDDTVPAEGIYWYRVATNVGGVRGPFTAPVPIYIQFLPEG